MVQALDPHYFARTFVRAETLDYIAALLPDAGPVGSYAAVMKLVRQMSLSFSRVADHRSYLKSDKAPLITAERGIVDEQMFGPILSILLSRSATVGECAWKTLEWRSINRDGVGSFYILTSI